MTRLSRHELAIARRFDRARRRRSFWAAVRRALHTPAGNFLLNTPIFLLPARINLQPKHRVLEVGCSTGANLRFLAARFRFHQPPVGLDISRATLWEARRHGEAPPFAAVAGSASRLPFADASFDLVIAPHVLRHLSGEGFMRFLVEAGRVLRPGGLLAVWDYQPATSGRRAAIHRRLIERLGGYGTPRTYGDVAHWVSEARFGVIENPDLRPFLFPPVPRVSLLARKPATDSPERTCANRPALP
jgi:SAM-dependent methyltransferase